MDPTQAKPERSSQHPRGVSELFKQELRDKYYEQQNRKVSAAPALDPADDLSADDLAAFSAHLKSSTRILALFGAGLSAASGIPTFSGPGGFW
ncbi:hypothetical protein AOQ84DRAFT_355375 [Glonium stellatum]|uniref:Deacetylase sirtuin-type domain-containing protein n=1 Tax=Glonium stellatum TaxID=574774 RepID=A0A8E2EXM1_9PEZI|nr:hypothetical protein AOQ84DRAFT_355375 [Glonium stellatum]